MSEEAQVPSPESPAYEEPSPVGILMNVMKELEEDDHLVILRIPAKDPHTYGLWASGASKFEIIGLLQVVLDWLQAGELRNEAEE